MLLKEVKRIMIVEKALTKIGKYYFSTRLITMRKYNSNKK